METSEIIKEVPLTREKVGWIENYYKEKLVQFYFDEGSDYNHNYRLPNKVDSFKAFRRKTDRIKDATMMVVMKMYSVDQNNRKTEWFD